MRTILIVDDERHVARVLRMALERAGYVVETASNGEQGLRKLVEISPDGLVTDIVMPRMTGRELVTAVCRKFPERQFPILVMTSSIELEHREWTTEVSDLYFVEKPVSPRKLVRILDDHFAADERCDTRRAEFEPV